MTHEEYETKTTYLQEHLDKWGAQYGFDELGKLEKDGVELLYYVSTDEFDEEINAILHARKGNQVSTFIFTFNDQNKEIDIEEIFGKFTTVANLMGAKL
jgi:hypothetical protein